MQGRIAYKHGKFDASPDQGGNLRMGGNEGVDHSGECLDGLKNGREPAGNAATFLQLVITIQLSGEYHGSVWVLDGADTTEFLPLIICQDGLEILNRIFE
jgi:hypothetical protein